MHSSELHLRVATVADQVFLRTLFEQVRGPQFASLGLPAEALTRLLDLQFTAQERAYRALSPVPEFLLVVLADLPIGRVTLQYPVSGTAVIDLALLPGWRGLGLGSRLLQDILADAGAAGSAVTLQVSADSPARRLYQRLGFEELRSDGLNVAMRWLPASASPPASHCRTPVA